MTSQHAWLLPAIGSMLSFSAMYLLFRGLIIRGISPEALTVFFFFAATIGVVGWALISPGQINWKIPEGGWIYFVALGLVAIPANFLSMRAVQLAANPGMVRGIELLGAVVVALAAIFIFGDSISLMKILGILVCIAGAMLITFG